MNPEIFPPPPPPPNYNTVGRAGNDGTLRLVVSLTEECHKLRQDLISQAQQLQERQSYINELEEAIRELGDDYDSNLSIISDQNKRIEGLEKALADKDRQHAKQLATMNKSHNEEMEILLQELTLAEKQSANLQSQLLQLEDSSNAKDSLILDLKVQIREYEKVLSVNAKIISDDVSDKVDGEDNVRSLTGLEVASVASELNEGSKDRGFHDDRDTSLKLSFPSIAFTHKKFSESDDDDDISPDKLTIRRDLSNKHHQKMKSSIPAFIFSSNPNIHGDKNGYKSVTFAKDTSELPVTSLGVDPSEAVHQNSKSWKNDRKHLNTFQEIDLKLERSYFHWESGDSAPNTPDRKVSRLVDLQKSRDKPFEPSKDS